MLQTLTVEAKTFELLKTFMRDPKLSQFCLVGGTALALYMGHRKSIDIDLFSQKEFDNGELESHLKNIYGFQTGRQSNATLIGEIDSVKVDCIRYNYPMVEFVKEYEGIRMYSIPDIAAMKLTAISQSGHRLKDFVDVAFLSSLMSLNEMLKAFEKKFPNTGKMSAVRGLTYFDDIDFSVEVKLVNGVFQWKKIEKRLIEMIKAPDKIFSLIAFNDAEIVRGEKKNPTKKPEGT